VRDALRRELIHIRREGILAAVTRGDRVGDDAAAVEQHERAARADTAEVDRAPSPRTPAPPLVASLTGTLVTSGSAVSTSTGVSAFAQVQRLLVEDSDRRTSPGPCA